MKEKDKKMAITESRSPVAWAKQKKKPKSQIMMFLGVSRATWEVEEGPERRWADRRGGYIIPTLIKTTLALGEQCPPAQGLSSDANIHIHRLLLQMSRCGPIGPV